MEVSNRPPYSPEEAENLARSHFGVEVHAVSELPSERDRNFKLTGPGGNGFVLKISNPGEKKETLDFQNSVLRRLQDRATCQIYPEIVPARRGPLLVQIRKGAASYWMRMLTFLPGIPLGELATPPDALLRSIGGRLAETDNILADLRHPGMNRHLYWDSKHALATVESNRPFLASTEEHELVGQFVNLFGSQVEPLLDRLPQSVIHNDANDYNLLVGTVGSQLEMTGLIDFGDIVRTFTICELANCCAYIMMSREDPFHAASLVIDAYHQGHPLEAAEAEALAGFIAIRLCLSVTNSARQKAQAPDNDYLVVSEKPAWNLLRRLAEVEPEQLRRTLRPTAYHSPLEE